MPELYDYDVIAPSGRRIRIKGAKDARQAKRRACREWGSKPGDKWCGIQGLQAFKVREEVPQCSNG